MTEAMPFLQKTILLSYDPRPLWQGAFPSVTICAKNSNHFSLLAFILFASPKENNKEYNQYRRSNCTEEAPFEHRVYPKNNPSTRRNRNIKVIIA